MYTYLKKKQFFYYTLSSHFFTIATLLCMQSCADRCSARREITLHEHKFSGKSTIEQVEYLGSVNEKFILSFQGKITSPHQLEDKPIASDLGFVMIEAGKLPQTGEKERNYFENLSRHIKSSKHKTPPIVYQQHDALVYLAGKASYNVLKTHAIFDEEKLIKPKQAYKAYSFVQDEYEDARYVSINSENFIGFTTPTLSVHSPAVTKTICELDHVNIGKLKFSLEGTITPEAAAGNEEVHFLFIKQGTTNPEAVCQQKVDNPTIWGSEGVFEKLPSVGVVSFRVAKVDINNTTKTGKSTIVLYLANIDNAIFEPEVTYITYLVTHNLSEKAIFYGEVPMAVKMPKLIRDVTVTMEDPIGCHRDYSQPQEKLAFTLTGKATPLLYPTDQVYFVFVKQGHGQTIQAICDTANIGKFANAQGDFAQLNGGNTDVVTLRIEDTRINDIAGGKSIIYNDPNWAKAAENLFEEDKDYTVYLVVYDPSAGTRPAKFYCKNQATKDTKIPKKTALAIINASSTLEQWVGYDAEQDQVHHLQFNLTGNITAYGGADITQLKPFFYFAPQGIGLPAPLPGPLPAQNNFNKNGGNILFRINGDAQANPQTYTPEINDQAYQGFNLTQTYDVYFGAQEGVHFFWSATSKQITIVAGGAVPDPQLVQIQSGNNIGAQLELQANYTTNNVDLAGATPGIFFLRKKGGNYTWPKAAQLAQIRALNAAYHRLSDSEVVCVNTTIAPKANENITQQPMYYKTYYDMHGVVKEGYFNTKSKYRPFFFQTVGDALFMGKPGNEFDTYNDTPPPTGNRKQVYNGTEYKINFDNNWIYKPGNKLGTLVLLDKTNATEKALMKDILKKIGIKDQKYTDPFIK